MLNKGACSERGLHMDIDVRNTVVVFDQLNKNDLKFDKLRSLIDGEIPESTFLPDPLSPTVINYKRAKLTISFVPTFIPTTALSMDTKLQMQVNVTAPENTTAARKFPNIIKQILESLPEHQSIIAFGFNFNCTIKNSPQKVHTIMSLPAYLPENSEFKFVPETFIKLSFDKNETKYYLDIQDNQDNVLIHVNVHHEIVMHLNELVNQVSNHYSSALDNSKQLISEVTKT